MVRPISRRPQARPREFRFVPPEQSHLGLFLDHRTDLLAYARRIVGDHADAEDVVQEAYLRFADAAKSRLIDEPVKYLYRIVRNLAIDGRRRLVVQAGRFVANGELAIRLLPDDSSPEAAATGRADLRALETAIAELPERTRTALEMHRFGGFTLKQIAERLGVSLGTAHALVVEGLEHCRAKLHRPRPN